MATELSGERESKTLQDSSLIVRQKAQLCSKNSFGLRFGLSKLLFLSHLRAGNMASQLHLYHWPGTAARSYATWAWSSPWGMFGWL